MTDHLKYYLIRIPAAALFLLLLVGLGSCRYAREKGLFLGRELKKAQSSTYSMSKIEADTTLRTDIITEDTVASGTDSSFSSKYSYQAGNSTDNYYYIIIGTYTNHSNAQAASSRYSSQGYTTSIINSTTSKGDRAELVAVKSFPYREQAEEYLKDFRIKVDPKAWIYPRK
jgi:hypothetical protein